MNNNIFEKDQPYNLNEETSYFGQQPLVGAAAKNNSQSVSKLGTIGSRPNLGPNKPVVRNPVMNGSTPNFSNQGAAQLAKKPSDVKPKMGGKKPEKVS